MSACNAGSIVRDTREKLHMSQTKFAERFGFNVTTLRQWEQGRRRPAASVCQLMMVIAYDPDAVEEAIRNARSGLTTA